MILLKEMEGGEATASKWSEYSNTEAGNSREKMQFLLF